MEVTASTKEKRQQKITVVHSKLISTSQTVQGKLTLFTISTTTGAINSLLILSG
jgi:hypothetical protein